MSGNLHDLIKSRLAGSDLNAEARALALAAVSGESNLASALAGVTPLPVPASAAGPLAAGGTYLRSIDVEGFRGVGPASRLDLNPGPGLTLIVGRNGSGKSSFAEGLEILLTSNNRRWSNRAAEWKGGWRNLHHGDTVRVSAEFIQEGNDKSTRVERSWAKDADLDKSTSFAQVHGKTRGEVADLGWAAALSTLRPILSYNELGSLLDEGPSKLYDALAAVLGLDELTAASDRLKKAATERSKTERDAKKEAKDVLVPRLAESDDARAVALAEMLGKRTVNLESIGKLVTDPGAAATGDITTLNAIANLAVPDAEEIREAAGRLREAHRDVEAVVGTEAGRARALASLLQQALAVHQHSGDGPCPVCGTGSIDAAWRKQAGQQIVKLKKQADEAEQANTKFNRARSELGSLMTSPPTILNEAASVGLDAKDAIAAWERWAALGAEPDVAVLIEKVEK
ncbi:MAG: AAA family ATPase, partial [Acidimicrobiia bacterium]